MFFLDIQTQYFKQKQTLVSVRACGNIVACSVLPMSVESNELYTCKSQFTETGQTNQITEENYTHH